MNNFDENNEFVRRPSGESNQPKASSPQRNIPGEVRRPQSSVNRPAAGDIRRPQAAPSQPRHPAAAPQRQNPIGNVRRPAQNTASRPPQYTDTSIPSANKSTMTPPEKQKQKKNGSILRNILIFIGMLAAMLILGFALLLFSISPDIPESDKTSYTYIMGDEEFSSVTINNVLYMNMSRLAEICSFVVSGTMNSMRFTADNNEYVEFTVGSRSAKINGDMVDISYGPALVKENKDIWIPLSFAEAYFNGLEFVKDEEKDTIEISRTELEGSTKEEPLYSDITFSIKGSQTLEGIEEDPDIGDIASLGFVNDLSEYEQYMNPADRDAYLILVNKTNYISAETIPENLVSIVNVRQDGRKEQMVECAQKALEALFIEMKSAGYTDVSVMSGYRSYNKQVSLFSTYLQREMSRNPSLTEEEAKEIVLTYSAAPGTSEHQTGLCCDMHNLPSADVSFANKEAYKWLKENCHKFGFVIRFPEDKVDITGYSFEPWHYRFVGRYHATRMKNLGMCLEEYVAHLKIAENN